eukprot:368388_1
MKDVTCIKKPCCAAPTCVKAECPPVCQMLCQYGNQVDANGCKICKCKPPPQDDKCPKDPCASVRPADKPICQVEKVTCVTTPCCPRAVCKEEKKCPPVCAKFCPNGNELDSNGCPICKCKKNVCPQVMCKKACQFGYKQNANGCDTCACK